MSGGELGGPDGAQPPRGAWGGERCGGEGCGGEGGGGEGEREGEAEAGRAGRSVRRVGTSVGRVGRVCGELRRGGERRSVIAAAVEVVSSCDSRARSGTLSSRPRLP